jgi:hypothetical protein
MHMSSSSPLPAAGEIDEELVASLGRLVGVPLAEERLPAVAARLRELFEIAAVLDILDLEGFEPAARFDPSWPERPEGASPVI